MGLDYSIYNSCSTHDDDNYYEISIPIANYHLIEGSFLNNTVCFNWEGFNGEHFYWKRENENVELYNDEEKLIEKLSLKEFRTWMDELYASSSSIFLFTPIYNILRSLETNEQIVHICFD